MTDLEKKVLNIVKNNDDNGRGLPAKSYYFHMHEFKSDGSIVFPDVSEKEFVDTVERLGEQGYFSYYENVRGEKIYSFASEEGGAGNQEFEVSNFLATLMDAFKNASEKELIFTAKTSILEFIHNSGMQNDQLIFKGMILAAKVGMSINSEAINDKEKQMVEEVFGDYYGGDMDVLFNIFNKKLPEEELQFIKMAGGTPVGIHLLKYILAFAYIDGELEEETAQMLDEYFAVALLSDFFEQSGE